MLSLQDRILCETEDEHTDRTLGKKHLWPALWSFFQTSKTSALWCHPKLQYYRASVQSDQAKVILLCTVPSGLMSVTQSCVWVVGVLTHADFGEPRAEAVGPLEDILGAYIHIPVFSLVRKLV